MTWFDWDLDEPPRGSSSTSSRKLVRIRQTQPVFQRRRFFKGRPIRGVKDISWLEPGGERDDRRGAGTPASSSASASAWPAT